MSLAVFMRGHSPRRASANMSPENIIKLFEIGREFGKYPIDIDIIDKKIGEEKKYLEK